MKSSLVIFAAALILSLTGCATVQMAPLDQDIEAKKFLQIPNKASLYIYRNENFGAAIPMTISVNGKVLGQTAAKTYFQLNIEPGQYDISSLTENVSTLPLTVKAENNYFVWQEVKMGMWSARSLLQQVDENTGRIGVSESKLISSLISDSDLSPQEIEPVTVSISQKSSSESISLKLRELESLRKDAIISEDDFNKKKNQLLEQL